LHAGVVRQRHPSDRNGRGGGKQRAEGVAGCGQRRCSGDACGAAGNGDRYRRPEADSLERAA
jgi:hypothetical protein